MDWTGTSTAQVHNGVTGRERSKSGFIANCLRKIENTFLALFSLSSESDCGSEKSYVIHRPAWEVVVLCVYLSVRWAAFPHIIKITALEDDTDLAARLSPISDEILRPGVMHLTPSINMYHQLVFHCWVFIIFCFYDSTRLIALILNLTLLPQHGRNWRSQSRTRPEPAVLHVCLKNTFHLIRSDLCHTDTTPGWVLSDL